MKYRVVAEVEVGKAARRFSFADEVEAQNEITAGIIAGVSGAAAIANRMGLEAGEDGHPEVGGPLIALSEILTTGRARALAAPVNAEAASPAGGETPATKGQTKGRKGSGRKRAGNAKARPRA